MAIKLNWKKNVFSTVTRIYSGEEHIGNLKDLSFSQTATGHIKDNSYTFKAKDGFLKQQYIVFDDYDNDVVGTIQYNNWKTKASIMIKGKSLNWEQKGIFGKTWKLIDSEGVVVDYSGSTVSGEMESTTEDALLLLVGLFISNYFNQMSYYFVLLIAVFLPIWIGLTN